MNLTNTTIHQYYKIKITTLIVLNCLTLGLFSFKWWYKNFQYSIGLSRYQKKTCNYYFKLIFMTLFNPLFCFIVFNNIANHANKTKTLSHWDPIIITVLYQVTSLGFILHLLQLLTHKFFLVLGFASFLTLIPVQMTLNILTYDHDLQVD